jgi:hypothetical protein
MTPGAKFSKSTSALRTSAFRSATPRGLFRLRVMARLLEFSIASGSEAPPPTASRARSGSPCGGSTLITSAPAWAIRNPA